MDNGRFCDSCNKTVIDFTRKSNSEIIEYIKANNHQRICGFLKSAQTKTNRFVIHDFLVATHNFMESKLTIRPIRFSLLYVLGIVMAVFGCQSKTTGEVDNIHSNDSSKCVQSDSTDSLDLNISKPLDLGFIHEPKNDDSF